MRRRWSFRTATSSSQKRSFARLVRSIRTALVTAPVSTRRAEASSIRPISALFEIQPGGADYLWAGPTHECVCGNNVFHLLVWFEDREVAGYFTEMICAFCGSMQRAPTLADEQEGSSLD